MNDARRRSFASAGVVGLATMSSRVLGLWREHIFGRLFGSGIYADAFNIAYRIPNLLRDLFAEGALSSALVPALVDARDKRGDAEVFLLARIVITALVGVIGLLSLLGAIFAPELVDLIAWGFADEPDKRALTVELTRWMMPFLLLISLAAVWRGLLNTFRVYAIPALAPALFNVASILVGYGLWWSGCSAETAIFGWALGMLLGVMASVLIQVPAAHRRGFRLRPALSFAHAGFRRILLHMTPAVIGLAGVQINIFVSSALASQADGDVSCLNYAFRLIFLPIGVVGVAVATVSTVDVSAAAAAEDRREMSNHLANAIALVAFFTLPATAGLIVLAEPVIRLIYEYGAFDADSTQRTAEILQWYAAGLFCYAAVKVVAPAFYAAERMRVPLVASTAGVATNILLAFILYPRLGAAGLALGTSLAAFVNFAVLYACARRMLPASERGVGAALAKMSCMAAAVAVVAWGVHAGVVALGGGAGTGAGAAAFLWRSAEVAVPIAATVIPFLLVSRALGLPEVGDLLATLRRLISGSRPA